MSGQCRSIRDVRKSSYISTIVLQEAAARISPRNPLISPGLLLTPEIRQISSGLLRITKVPQSHQDSSARRKSASLIRTLPHAGNPPLSSGLLRTPILKCRSQQDSSTTGNPPSSAGMLGATGRSVSPWGLRTPAPGDRLHSTGLLRTSGLRTPRIPLVSPELLHRRSGIGLIIGNLRFNGLQF